MTKTRETITKDVASYLGWTEEKLRSCEVLVAPDPSHHDVAAVRVKAGRFGTLDLLWSGSVDSIEECTWESFPPRSR